MKGVRRPGDPGHPITVQDHDSDDNHHHNHGDYQAAAEMKPEEDEQGLDEGLALWTTTDFTFDQPPALQMGLQNHHDHDHAHLDDHPHPHQYPHPHDHPGVPQHPITSTAGSSVASTPSSLLSPASSSSLSSSASLLPSSLTASAPSLQPKGSAMDAHLQQRQSSHAALGGVFSSMLAPGFLDLKMELGFDEEDFEKKFEKEFEKELEQEFGSKKRKVMATSADEPGASDDDEDGTLAEKRRRNTAASARFRLKKKMKEQRLDAMAKLMNDRANVLQKKVEELEAEVGYLRDLVTLRRDQRVTDFIQL